MPCKNQIVSSLIMKIKVLFFIILSTLLLLAGCSKTYPEAEAHLHKARLLLSESKYTEAKAELDSIHTNYSKAADQRRAALLLLDSIRFSENTQLIELSSKELIDYTVSREELLEDFKLVKDEKYQTKGIFYPKNIANQSLIAATDLEVGIYEDGPLFLKSIYIGSQKHNQIKLEAGSESKESLVIPNDFITRFDDLGKTYEIMNITANYQNGLVDFLAEHKDKNIDVVLLGNVSKKYRLSNKSMDNILKASNLSKSILAIDSLQHVIDKAKTLNHLLENKVKPVNK